MTATSTTTPGEATRRGPARPLIAAALGLVSMPLVFVFALAAWPLMIAGFVLAVVSIRRRDRVWGFSVAAIVALCLAVGGMFVPPALLFMFAWALGGRFDEFAEAWAMFWGLAWNSWLGPLAG